MFFEGSISIDPSHQTLISQEKPTKAFRRMLYAMTAGLVHDSIEHETFCAISILQRLNEAMRSLGINNIVRLAIDDCDFYLDTKGKKDDMKQALESFEQKINPELAQNYMVLHLVIEHEDKNFRYIADIKVFRLHDEGDYPIEITVNGVFIDFNMPAPKGKAGSWGKKGMKPPAVMNQVFSSQDAYDAHLRENRTAFQQFMEELKNSIHAHLDCDDIKMDTRVVLVRALSPVKTRSICLDGDMDASPLFHGYPFWSEASFYTLIWADMCHTSSISINDFYMMDHRGNEMLRIHQQGFDAGSMDTMNTQTVLAPPKGVDFEKASGFRFPTMHENEQIREEAEVRKRKVRRKNDKKVSKIQRELRRERESKHEWGTLEGCGACGGCS